MFANDYSEGAEPKVLFALSATNSEQHPGYGEGDLHCEHARELIRSEIGRDDVDVEFCIGGTSANIIAVTGLLRDWEGVICTPDAHINVHETGAIAAAGRTILPTRDTDGFLSADEAERVWQFQTSTGRHMTKPAAIYISNTTELGGVWTLERFDEVCDWAHARGLAVYLDGARLGSALTADENDLTLAHIAEQCDAFTIGGTKNGLMFGEAMVIANDRLREAFPYLIKERGGLLAKGRLIGVQFEAAFEHENGEEALFWRMARKANERAMRLREGLIAAGYEPYGNSTSNQQFFVVPPLVARQFEVTCGSQSFYTLPDGNKVIRFVCSWATQAVDVEELIAFAEALKLY